MKYRKLSIIQGEFYEIYDFWYYPEFILVNTNFYDLFLYKTDKRDEKDLTMEQQCESLAYEIELKNEKISKLQTSLNEKTLQLEKEQGMKFLWVLMI